MDNQFQAGESFMNFRKSRAVGKNRSRVVSLAAFALLCGVAQQASAVVIDAFRVRGPNGANDEYVQIYNNSASPHTVTASSGTGYAIAASDGVVRCTIPNGTVIPAHGHYLCVNSVGYSLASYPAGNGTTATGDATYTTDIPDQSGIALFNNNTGGGSFTLANRLDAVGPTGEANTLYREGTGLPALVPFSIDYSWVRDICGRGGAVNVIGPCPSSTGLPIDTDNNSADFFFVDTNGTSAGGGQRLGSGGPQNLSSPVFGLASVTHAALDSCAIDTAAPNVVRDFTSDPANNSTFGTLDIRRTFTNNTGAPITRLRFRVIDLDTFPAASGFSDLRPRTSTSVVVTVDRPPCGSGTSNVTVAGTTLEQPPSQPNGGGFYSTLSVNSVTAGTPLANGASIDVRFLLGIQQTGTYRIALIAETLPDGGALFQINGCTDGACASPTVSSINRVNTTPSNAASVQYTVTFSESVTGVNAADFALTTTGTIAGASVTGVSGSGSSYTVTVNTGTGDGTLRLDVVDDDSIVNAGLIALGGAGAGNGNFTTGQVYTIDKTAPTVTINQAAGQTDPAAASPINFTTTFSEAVTGFTNADITLGGTAGATTAVVTGGPTVYNVAVSGMIANGSVTVGIVASAAVDSAANASQASTSTDNNVTFSGINSAPSATASIAGTAQVGQILTGSYVYSDVDSNPEDTSGTGTTYRFVRSIDNSVGTAGDNVDVATGTTGGSNRTYTVQPADQGRYLFYCVTPRASAGTSPGSESCSSAAGVVLAAPPAAPIPTLSEWGMILLSGAMAIFGLVQIRRRHGMSF